MKKGCLWLLAAVMSSFMAMADVQGKKWSEVATKMPDAWYGTDEAIAVAENVLLYQKNSGGWAKNIEMHKTLSEAQKQEVINAKSDKSCFDNTATTLEMRFLAKVYKHIKDERYYTAFNKGFNCILKAQYATGGWPQYYPLRGGYSDYITFNDDLMVNLLKLMHDVFQAKNEFASIATDDMMSKAELAYDKGIQCILDCQIDDYGKKSIWCAQHDPKTLLPAEGRPHEHPSYSGSEGAKILDFLMTIENPSEEIKQAVVAAAQWFDKHHIKDKKVVDVSVNGVKDRQIVDAPGQRLWGRFMQLSGPTAETVRAAMIKKLSSNKRTVKSKDGKSFTYYCSNILKESWDMSREYEFVYGIYDSNRQQLYYRFLYNYAGTEPYYDKNNVKIETCLGADNRCGYQYVGNWPQKVVYTTYPAWKKKYQVSALDAIGAEPAVSKVGVYNIQGQCLFSVATEEALQSLSPGFYIVDGKKYMVK